METKYDENQNQNLKLVIGLNRTVNDLSRRSQAIFKQHGLTTMQFSVLEVLYHKGSLKTGEIIEKALSTGGNMTVVIQNLLRAKMIYRQADPKDCRAYVISITELGRQKIEEIFPEHLIDLDNFFHKLGSEEKAQLLALLKKIKD